MADPTPNPWTLAGDLKEFFGIELPQRDALEHFAAGLRRRPMETTLLTALGTSVLFYLAERGRNPKVNDIFDAMVYCTTCMSVGYSDIFAKTPAGKVVGSLLMTVGPPMVGAALDGPHEQTVAEQTQQQILATLRGILAEVRQGHTANSEPAAEEPPTEE